MLAMDPIKIYDYLTRARAKWLGWIRPLTAEQYARDFRIGPGSIRAILTHVLISEWYFVRRMRRFEVPPYGEWPYQDEKPLDFPDLERAWGRQADETRAALGEVGDWDAEMDYPMTVDDRPPEIMTVSRGDIFSQLCLHEVHHRAQVLHILKQLGVKLEDIDYNVMMYKRRPARA